ncbi:uncharacterized metal-dependent hydrolase TatD-like [Saccostrea cucullata]|uniref:uncharacterized metal-dependent hydrolase TatD-like n=1 Tax=Saccostrea cuccullata TaxID=36930 RepID=UPI002ED1DDBE
MNDDMILGIDFLEANHRIINIKKGVLFLEGRKFPIKLISEPPEGQQRSDNRIRRTTCVPPITIAKVSVKLDKPLSSDFVAFPLHLKCNVLGSHTLLKGLSMEQQEMFRQHQQRLLANGMTIDRPFDIAGNPVMARIVDSHFHLDQILRRTNFKTWFELEQQFGGRVQVLHAVANYVFPRQWESWQVHVLDDENISVSFGIHPHVADLAGQYLDRLMDLVTHHRCVAVGEVGIDLTTNCRCNPCVRLEARKERFLHTQQEFLADALNMARDVDKHVILHCRDDGSGEAAKRTLVMIRMMDMTHHTFHRHCFTGSV